MKKLISLSCVLALLALCLSGCMADKPSANPTDAPTATVAAATDAPTDAPTATIDAPTDAPTATPEPAATDGQQGQQG